MSGPGAFIWFTNCFKATGSGVDADPYIPTVNAIIDGGGVYSKTIVFKGSAIVASGASQLLMSANSARVGWEVENTSLTAKLYIGLSSGSAVVSGSNMIVVNPGGFYGDNQSPIYTGTINVTSDTVSSTFYAAEFT